MTRDPIMDEVRAIRDTIAREHNYDLDAIFQMLREREAQSRRPHITLPPKELHVEKRTGPANAAQPGDAD